MNEENGIRYLGFGSDKITIVRPISDIKRIKKK